MHWGLFKKAESGKQKTIDAAGASQPRPAEFRCPLCGKKFHAGEALACTGCALAARCGLVMCPNCSYEFAP